MSHQQQLGAQMRGDAVRVFAELNESTKAQQAFLNSCGDATWISEEERRAIHWLLSALIDHRRRIRVTGRLWRTLNPTEPVPCELVPMACGGHRSDTCGAKRLLAQHVRTGAVEPGRGARCRRILLKFWAMTTNTARC